MADVIAWSEEYDVLYERRTKHREGGEKDNVLIFK